MITMIWYTLLLGTVVANAGGADAISSDDIEAHTAAARRARVTCGPISVWYCLRRCGTPSQARTVLERAEIEEQGVRLDRLLQLARSFGLPAQALAFEPKDLSAVPTPAILVTSDQHCVVLDRAERRSGQASIFEPATRRVGPESLDFLTTKWTGEAIVFSTPPLSWAEFWFLAVAGGVLVAVGWVIVRYLAGPRKPGRQRLLPHSESDRRAADDAPSLIP
jgi:hypothetical protein